MTSSTRVSNTVLLGIVFGINVIIMLLLQFYEGSIIRQVELRGFECSCENSLISHAVQSLVSAFQTITGTCPAATAISIVYTSSGSARTVIVACWILDILLLLRFKRKDVSFCVEALGVFTLATYFMTGAWDAYTLVALIGASNLPVVGFFIYEWWRQTESIETKENEQDAVPSRSPAPNKLKGGSGKRRSDPQSGFAPQA